MSAGVWIWKVSKPLVLSTSADKEDVRVENSGEGSDISNRAEETAAALPREPAGVGEGEEAAAQSLMDFTLPGSQDYLASPHQFFIYLNSESSLGFSAAFSCPKCSRCSPDGVQVAPDDDKVHSETEDEKLSVTDEKGRFGCPDCEKSFKFQSLLKAHRRIHTGEQPFLCLQCGCRFSFKQSLERHKLTHTSGRSYDCLICGGFFKSLLALKEHSSSHVENGEYLCRECGRAFAWKSASWLNPSRSSAVNPAFFLFPLGFFKSISWWATLRSPHSTTGFCMSSSLRYVRKSTSHVLR
uniref:C2H2-type domain-containing protein n=1 Tax=Takifugu rubripes TaxID=31033 RepID=A0A674N8R6_TAKRU